MVGALEVPRRSSMGVAARVGLPCWASYIGHRRCCVVTCCSHDCQQLICEFSPRGWIRIEGSHRSTVVNPPWKVTAQSHLGSPGALVPPPSSGADVRRLAWGGGRSMLGQARKLYRRCQGCESNRVLLRLEGHLPRTAGRMYGRMYGLSPPEAQRVEDAWHVTGCPS